MSFRALAPAAIAVALLASPAGAVSVSVPALRDNTLFQDAQGDTSSGAGEHLFTGRNSQGRVRRAVVAFDVSLALPDGAQLDSVTLVLHLSSSSDPLPRLISLHRVLAAWGEGASAAAGGSGAPAQAGDATWLHTFYPSATWFTPGGDFDATPAAATVVLGDGDYAWSSPALADDVRDWLADPAASHGWLLQGDESEPGTARRFDAREYPDPALRPRLILHYSMSTPSRPTSWGALKRRFR